MSSIWHMHDERMIEYVHSILPKSPSILASIEDDARQRGIPIVGPLIGRLLFLLILATRAKRVLEIGTAVGYSTIWLGLAAKKVKGRVTSIEIDHTRADEARANIHTANLDDTVEVITGDALDVIPRLKGRFNLIFIDDSKDNYPRYFELCYPRLSKNGLLVADNALWHGEVLKDSKEGKAVARFNSMLISNMDALVLPVRDGLAIGIKGYR
ncbi:MULTISPECIES: O-methyltransferase [Candidatus Nitrosocaldus]|nr:MULTISPECIES: O-methyltransferase [Candidatus Nitrosocaldus]